MFAKYETVVDTNMYHSVKSIVNLICIETIIQPYC